QRTFHLPPSILCKQSADPRDISTQATGEASMNRSRPTRSAPTLGLLVAILSFGCLYARVQLVAQVTVSNTGAAGSSGLNANEGASIASCGGGVGCGSVHTDSMWADSSIHRWVMQN